MKKLIGHNWSDKEPIHMIEKTDTVENFISKNAKKYKIQTAIIVFAMGLLSMFYQFYAVLSGLTAMLIAGLIIYNEFTK